MNKIQKTVVKKYFLYVCMIIVLFVALLGCANTVADSPTENLTPKKLVLIDPGHGGEDMGTAFTENENTVTEKDLTLQVSLLLCEMLKNSKVNVAMTRQEDQEVSLEERMELVSSSETSLFLSIHFDNGTDGSNVMVIQYNSLTDEKTVQSIYDNLKEKLNPNISQLIPMEVNLKFSNIEVPTVIVDMPYMTGNSDQNQPSTEEYTTEIAEALYNSIISD